MVITTSLLIISFGWNFWQHHSTQRQVHPQRAAEQPSIPSPVLVNPDRSGAPQSVEIKPTSPIPSDARQVFYELKQQAINIREDWRGTPGNLDRFVALGEAARLFIHDQARVSELDSIVQQIVLLEVLRNVPWSDNLVHAMRFIRRWSAAVDLESVMIPKQLDAVFREAFQSSP
jgi:hypothetical protein